jgi:hypothetical protein
MRLLSRPSSSSPCATCTPLLGSLSCLGSGLAALAQLLFRPAVCLPALAHSIWSSNFNRYHALFHRRRFHPSPFSRYCNGSTQRCCSSATGCPPAFNVVLTRNKSFGLVIEARRLEKSSRHVPPFHGQMLFEGVR